MQTMASAFSEDLEISAQFFFMPVQQMLDALGYIDRSQNCSQWSLKEALSSSVHVLHKTIK